MARLITVVAKEGGPDPEANFKLRQTIAQAQSMGLPKDNIERAIERSRGGGEGDAFSEVEYEAYGPGGSAFLISGLTDNTNRTTNEVKRILNDHDGRLAESGSVAWLFARRVIMEFDVPLRDTEDTELNLIDAGAEDTILNGGRLAAVISPEKAESFERALKTKNLNPSSSTFAAVAKNSVVLDTKTRTKVDAMVEALEDHPDINSVSTNIADEDI